MKKVLLALLVFLFCPIIILAADKVELNTASLAQLDGLTGIGPALAQRIINARPYSSVDDLLRVKGIGTKTLQDIKNQGLAYVAGQAQTSAVQPMPSAAPAQPSPPAVIAKPEITYPAGIVINEMLPSPDGSDETNEFIELYNSNAVDVDISNWKLQDIQGTQTTYIFPKDSKILAGAYLALKRPETNIMLNNDQDGVNLLWPDGKIIDTVSYTSAPAKQSYNKTADGWQWSTTPTPSAANIIGAPILKLAATPKTALPKTKKTSVASITINEPANLDKSIFTANVKQGASSSWLLLLAAGAIAVICGITFLLLKLMVFKK